VPLSRFKILTYFPLLAIASHHDRADSPRSRRYSYEWPPLL